MTSREKIQHRRVGRFIVHLSEQQGKCQRSGSVMIQALVKEKICRHYRSNTTKRPHTTVRSRPLSFCTRTALRTNSLLFDLHSQRNDGSTLETSQRKHTKRLDSLFCKVFHHMNKSVNIDSNEDHTFDLGHVRDKQAKKTAVSGHGHYEMKRSDGLNMANHETSRMPQKALTAFSQGKRLPLLEKERSVKCTSLERGSNGSKGIRLDVF